MISCFVSIAYKLNALAKCQEKPLVDLLGRHHHRLPTSITIGIKSPEESLEDTRKYFAAGFKSIKLKIGLSVEKDIEIVTKMRELLGQNIKGNPLGFPEWL